MKKNHFIIAALWLSIASCGSYYRMTSTINRDGSMDRTVYTKADSAFLAGDFTHNPFIFKLNNTWKPMNLDSTFNFNFWGEQKQLNAAVHQTFSNVNGEHFTSAAGKEHMRSLAVPTEHLQKRFLWFYTYYTYTATYHELPNKGPVPLSNYLSKEELSIWLQGTPAAFKGMNGVEINDKLNEIEDKFSEWFRRSQYEISCMVLSKFIRQQGNEAYAQRLDELKDTLYAARRAQNYFKEEISVDSVCTLFDAAYKTNYYSTFYQANANAIDSLCEEQGKAAEALYDVIKFELTMPGNLLSSNARSIEHRHTVTWKIDGIRLLASDYVLTAESRVVNYWAFIGTILLALGVLGVCVWRYTLARH